MSGTPRVLFVGHDASRTGAPSVLRSFLGWLTRSTDAEVTLVLQRGGPLVADFRRAVPTTVLDRGPRRVIGQAVAGLRTVRPAMPGWVDAAIAGPALRRARPDVIVVNTLAALGATVLAAPKRIPIVCHVHELDGVASRVLPPAGPTRDQALAAVTRFVAAGPAVQAMLVDRWRIPPALVAVVDEFIDEPAATALDGQRARRDLDRGPDDLVVVAAGATGPRKGTDYFIALAAALATHPTQPTFVWAGGDPTSTAWAEAAYDIEAAGLGGRVRMLASQPDIGPLMVGADILVSTAREDPYPLVALEAGAAGTPVAGFDSGGVTTIAKAGGLGGAMVPVGDVLALADRVGELANDRTERERLGRGLSAWVRSTHLTDQMAPLLWRAIVEAT